MTCTRNLQFFLTLYFKVLSLHSNYPSILRNKTSFPLNIGCVMVSKYQGNWRNIYTPKHVLVLVENFLDIEVYNPFRLSNKNTRVRVRARARARVCDRSSLLSHFAASIRVNECLACSPNFSAIKNSRVTCLCEILFQIRENVLEDFRNVKTSVWGRNRE